VKKRKKEGVRPLWEKTSVGKTKGHAQTGWGKETCKPVRIPIPLRRKKEKGRRTNGVERKQKELQKAGSVHLFNKEHVLNGAGMSNRGSAF